MQKAKIEREKNIFKDALHNSEINLFSKHRLIEQMYNCGKKNVHNKVLLLLKLFYAEKNPENE